MAQLVNAVSATVKRWKVDEIPDARYVKAGDEIVEVLTRYPSRGVIRVLRGAEDSTAASHDAGTALESPLMGGAGGEQTIRLIGPFTVSHDTPNLGTLALLAPLDAGTTVIGLTCEVVEAWEGGTATDARLTVGAGGATGGTINWYAMRRYLVGADDVIYALDDETAGTTYQLLGQTDYADLPAWVRFPFSEAIRIKTGGGGLVAQVEDAAGATFGEAHIYALIAEPA